MCFDDQSLLSELIPLPNGDVTVSFMAFPASGQKQQNLSLCFQLFPPLSVCQFLLYTGNGADGKCFPSSCTRAHTPSRCPSAASAALRTQNLQKSSPDLFIHFIFWLILDPGVSAVELRVSRRHHSPNHIAQRILSRMVYLDFQLQYFQW